MEVFLYRFFIFIIIFVSVLSIGCNKFSNKDNTSEIVVNEQEQQFEDKLVEEISLVKIFTNKLYGSEFEYEFFHLSNKTRTQYKGWTQYNSKISMRFNNNQLMYVVNIKSELSEILDLQQGYGISVRGNRINWSNEELNILNGIINDYYIFADSDVKNKILIVNLLDKIGFSLKGNLPFEELKQISHHEFTYQGIIPITFDEFLEIESCFIDWKNNE